MQSTFHPTALPGETAGKGANINWAAKGMLKKYELSLVRNHVLVTVIDSMSGLLTQAQLIVSGDVHLLNQHFQILNERYPSTMRDDPYVLYVPPVVFDRNAHRVPSLVRMADMIWGGAGLSCFRSAQLPNGVAFPTAVYTLSLPLLRFVNGWDTGPDAIGEDMHMMLKCYFATNGKLRIESLPSPASLCNVSTSRAGIRGWIQNVSARYTQSLRHMWGSLDVGYAISQWLKMRPRSDARYRRNSADSTAGRFTWRTMLLFFRLFEAHFLPAHFFLIMLASTIYQSLPVKREWFTQMTMASTGCIGAILCSCMTAYFALVYERYHQICVTIRKHEMTKNGLQHEIMSTHRRRLSRWLLLNYIMFPVAGMLYGTMPLLQATMA